MAQILPTNPVGPMPPETLRVFRLLTQLPELFVVWQRLAMADDGPDFWVRHQDSRCALLKVATATRAEIRQARQGTLFAPAATPGASEQAALGHFWAGLELPDAPCPHALLPGLVLFPSVPHDDLDRALAPPPPGIHRGTKADLRPEAFGAWLDARLGPPLAPAHTDAVRRAFAPESIIPAQLTVRTPFARATDAGLTDALLSYNQEWVLKHDLDLSDEAEAASADLRLQLVSRVGEAVLPPPPALRTVRVRFRTHGSSLGNAPCGTRLRYR